MNNLKSMTDEQLVRLYLGGNNSAFDTLLNRYESKVFTHIYHMVKNRELANDMFQDVFMRVIEKLHNGKYVEDGKFSSWVMRLAHNLVLDYFRKEVKYKMVYEEENVDIFNTTNTSTSECREAEMITTQNNKDLKVLIDSLPEKQKEIVIMRYYYDLSFKDIANTLGISINTALGRIRYALINMRKQAAALNIEVA